MEIRRVAITQIKAAAYNPRKDLQPGDLEYEKLKRSMEEFDCVEPLVWNERTGNLVGGHQRLKILIARGDTEVECSVVDLSPEREKALNLALNKISGDWDNEKLAHLLDELVKVPDFDVGLTGFDVPEVSQLLDGLLPQDGAEDGFDVAAELEKIDEAETQRGDLWILGEHRLLCGDSGKAEDVDRLLDGARIQLVNTDPPYGVKVEPRSGNAIVAGRSSFLPSGRSHPGLVKHQRSTESVDGQRAKKKRSQMHHQAFDEARQGKKHATTRKLRPRDRVLEGDFVSGEEYVELLRGWFGQIARVLEPGRSFYIWGGYANLGNYPPVLKDSGLYFSQGIVWDKQWPVLTRKDFMGAFELCFYGWREGAGHQFFGPNNATDLWRVKKIAPPKMVHLTEKPVELALRAISYSSCRGENVLDLFGGSGSTLVACERASRRAFLMEIDRPYCDVIVRRWEKLTGRKAARIGVDGQAASQGGREGHERD